MEISKFDVVAEDNEFAPELPIIKMFDFVTINNYQENASRLVS